MIQDQLLIARNHEVQTHRTQVPQVFIWVLLLFVGSSALKLIFFQL